MLFTKNADQGVFPGISVQLFNFDTPVSAVAMVSCHSLPASWGAFHLPNEEGNRTMIFSLEDSPFEAHSEEYDEDSEEYRPLNGNVWVFHGDSESMWDLVKNKPDSFINCLVYHKLDQTKKFSANVLELRAQGYY